MQCQSLSFTLYPVNGVAVLPQLTAGSHFKRYVDFYSYYASLSVSICLAFFHTINGITAVYLPFNFFCYKV